MLRPVNSLPRSARIGLVVLGLVGLSVTSACRRRRPVQHPQTDPAAASASASTGAPGTAAPSGGTTAAPTSTAPAVVSDADRAAARELYNEAASIQATRPKDALEKFQRSQAVVAAPTTALHIAQCQVALGRWVEASEGYRAIGRMELAANASKPFVDAQATASKELGQLEQRLPHLRIVVTPEKLAGLTVTLDGQPVNVALVGVPRPADPGHHTLSVSAPGYLPAEQGIDLKERESKDATIVLKKK